MFFKVAWRYRSVIPAAIPIKKVFKRSLYSTGYYAVVLVKTELHYYILERQWWLVALYQPDLFAKNTCSCKKLFNRARLSWKMKSRTRMPPELEIIRIKPQCKCLLNMQIETKVHIGFVITKSEYFRSSDIVNMHAVSQKSITRTDTLVIKEFFLKHPTRFLNASLDQVCMSEN